MKKKRTSFYGKLAQYVAMLCCLFLATGLYAQQPGSLFSRYARSTEFMAGHLYYVVSDPGPGAAIVRQLDEHTAIVEINDAVLFSQFQSKGPVAVADDSWKCTPAVNVNDLPRPSALYILSGRDITALHTAVEGIAGVTIVQTDPLSRSVVVRLEHKALFTRLLALPEVIFADIKAKAVPETNIIGYDRSFHGINALDYLVPGANGKSIVAGVKEQKMEAADLDLYKRVSNSSLASATVSNHATVIASIIGGSGNSFYDGRGMAWGCLFFPSSFDNLFADDAAVLNTAGVSVQNHSYGTVVQSFYGAEALSYDAHARSQHKFLHIFSAGNRGTAVATDGRYAGISGYANLTGNFKAAKNIITVAAIDNKEVVPAESSAGPLYDGRLAPQLTALGPNGTSDAAAMVSGAVAVLQQVYADSNSHALPPASLVKALLYTTADDIYTTGIDYKTGYGLLNSYGAVKALQQKQFDGGTVGQSQVWSMNLSIPANTAAIRLTLAWTDTAAALNNTRALVNDLDLELIETATGTVYKPWVLSVAAHADSLAKLPQRKRDSLNTAEQVSIALPAAGNWQVKVTGTAVTGSPQAFHIAWKTDTLNTFRFTSPVHTSDVNRAENPQLVIRWNTFVADTNQTGDLSISYNGGTTWQPVQNGIRIYRNKYSWPVKDTSSRAMFRMQTGFGTFMGREFVISPVNRPVLDFVCLDSFGFSWNRHVYAASYNIYCLTDSPYLKKVMNVTDTAIILKRVLYPSLVWAVEPVLSNGLPAARSIAFDITQQGTQCFYRTLYYNQIDNALADLVLEISAPAYTDSVFFEQLSPDYRVLRRFGGVKVQNGVFVYHQPADLPAGTSYWQAVVRLRSGQIVYTDIIPITSSGSRNLLFYPNPLPREQPLFFISKVGLPSDCRLQFYDISGRLVKDINGLQASYNLSGLPAGVYLYRLLGPDGLFLETGKLAVQ